MEVMAYYLVVHMGPGECSVLVSVFSHCVVCLTIIRIGIWWSVAYSKANSVVNVSFSLEGNEQYSCPEILVLVSAVSWCLSSVMVLSV